MVGSRQEINTVTMAMWDNFEFITAPDSMLKRLADQMQPCTEEKGGAHP